MGTPQLKNRAGKTISQTNELAKKTAEHAGVPRETALYIITAFIDVLADEIVTKGGASIPGIISFYTKDVKSKSLKAGAGIRSVKRFDKELGVRVAKPMETLFRMHSVFCKDGERIITPDSWSGFNTRYSEVLRRNNFGSGVVYAVNVRKKDANLNSIKKEDYIDLEKPIYCDYFGVLVKEMNHAGIFDVSYHVDTGKELFSGENRLLRMSDLTDESTPYIMKNKLERFSEIRELINNGTFTGIYAENMTNTKKVSVAFNGDYQFKS